MQSQRWRAWMLFRVYYIWLFQPTCFCFFKFGSFLRVIILQSLREEAATDTRWGQESDAPSLLFECRSNKLWSCTILHIISTPRPLTGWRLGLKKYKTERLLSYFVSENHPLCFSFYYYFFFLSYSFSVSPSASQQTVSADTALQWPGGLVEYDQKPISSGSNGKKSGQSSGER